MDPRRGTAIASETQLFERLAKLRHEETKLRAITATGVVDAKRSARLQQIAVEAAEVWSGIRSARAASRAAYRARNAPPPLDPFRQFTRDQPRR